MRILVVGGGSGGHLTPALAILEALAVHDPDLKIVLVCDRKFASQAQTILSGSKLPIRVKTVWAGKLRRYYGIPLWRQLIDVPTVILNIRDLFLLSVGLLQSWLVLGKFKPNIVFAKGGFVCLPVGFAAHLRHIPLVIHDSDAHPGLTNRILAKWATKIATGAPVENYPYDRTRTHYVGIPVTTNFKPLGAEQRFIVKRLLMADPSRPLLVVTGGGLGAARINQAMLEGAQALIAGGLEVIHIAGAAHGEALERKIIAEMDPEMSKFYHVKSFVDPVNMAQLLQVADVVVSRGGATAIAELAILGKASILIPNPHLTGGHQLKNAAVLGDVGAVMILQEENLTKNSTILQQSILALSQDPQQRQAFEKAITAFAKPNAAEDVAKMILETSGQGRKGE